MQVNVNTTGATRTSGGSASGGWARGGAAARWRSSRWAASARGGRVAGGGERARPAPAPEALQAARGGRRPQARAPREPSRPVLAACREDRSTFFYICVFYLIFEFSILYRIDP